MTDRKHQVWSLTSGPRAAIVALAIVFALTVAAAPASQAQTYTVIHNFTGGGDGASPFAGLRMDTAGNLYGTANSGGANNLGTVFKMRHYGSAWVLTTLYSFAGNPSDGAYPEGTVSLAQDGTLYGTTLTGGGGVGTVFHLRPSASAPKSALASWNETLLYSFSILGSDGQEPEGDLLFDPSGNIYGTTFVGGINNKGVIYELAPSGGGWTQSVIYSARNNGDGSEPASGVIRDASGNLYGVFAFGGPHNYGAVYELSPSGSGWTEQTVYGFTFGSDGGIPFGGVIMDSSGNLYGTTSSGGNGGGGTVFELTPANGGWTLTTLYSFSGGNYSGPRDKLVMDAAGNLYGTTHSTGPYQAGTVFKLTPSNGGWIYTSLHDFAFLDGYYPVSSLVFDVNGNLYGTTSLGGTGTGCNGGGCGVVFEITP